MSAKLPPFEIGTKFGDWTVVAQVDQAVSEPSGQKSMLMSVVRCVCGKERTLANGYLRAGNSKGCGCVRDRAFGASSYKHGISRTWIHRLWSSIKHRLKNYKPYEGITMYEPWVHDAAAFEAFIVSLGPKPTPEHTLDRIDPYGNYEPGNLRWADKSMQSFNRRNNRKRTVEGNGTGALRIKVGEKYSQLTVVEVFVDSKHNANWYKAKARCDCGNTTEVYQEQLVKGRTKSCGCLKSRNLELAHKALEKPIEFKGETHSYTQWAKKLGVSKNLLWERINKLGWSVEKTLTTPVIDRAQQIEVNGETLPIATWAERIGVPPRVIWHRIHNLKWDKARAVSTPARKYTKRTTAPVSDATETPPASFPSDVDPDTSSTVQ